MTNLAQRRGEVDVGLPYDRRQNVRRLHRDRGHHGGVVAERGGEHESVPDRVLKTQAPPRMETTPVE